MKFMILLVLIVTVNAGWQVVPSNGTVPSNRGGGQMREINGQLILFGGYDECFDENSCEHVFYDELYHFDLFTGEWSQPTTTPDSVYGKPSPRAYFSACVDEEEQALVVYGGTVFPVQFVDFTQWNMEANTFDDLWYYYPDEYRWSRVETFGDSPGRRSGAGIEIVGRTLVLSSGIDTNTFFSVEDTYGLNLITKEWTRLTGHFSSYLGNPFPFDLGRYIFPFVKHENSLYLLSGNIIPIPPLLGEQYQDVWRYKVSMNTWEEVLPFNGTGFTGRVHGGMVEVGGRLIAFFGDNNDDLNECEVDSISSGQSPIDETWRLKLNPVHQRSWELLDLGEVPALKRIYYTNSESFEKVYVFGGFSMSCPESNLNGTLTWNNEVYSVSWSDLL